MSVCGGSTTDSYYSTTWQVLEEDTRPTCGPATVQSQYVWSLSYIDDLLLRDDNSSSGNLGKSSSGLGRRIYAEQDANHNVISLSDTTSPTAVVLERFVYDPYGSVTVLTASTWATTTDSKSWVYYFQGGRYDASSGLYSFRFRDYNPVLGRWMQEDPAGYVDGANRYQFVSSNPANLVDPFGLTGGDEDGELERAKLEEEQREWEELQRQREIWEAMHEETPAERADREAFDAALKRGQERKEQEEQRREKDLEKNAKDSGTPLRNVRPIVPRSPAAQRLRDALDDLIDLLNSGKAKLNDALDRADELLRNSSDPGRCPETGNYRGRYNAARGALGRPRLPKDYEAHHRIPQRYRDRPDFRDRDLDAPSNIQGLPGPKSGQGNIHSRMTTDWEDFNRAHPNAGGPEILDFANQMDAKYRDYIYQ